MIHGPRRRTTTDEALYSSDDDGSVIDWFETKSIRRTGFGNVNEVTLVQSPTWEQRRIRFRRLAACEQRTMSPAIAYGA